MAGTQSSTFSDIESYTFGSEINSPADILSFLTPPILCIIVLMIWSLNTIGEIQSTFDLFRGLFSIPIAKTSELRVDDDGESITLMSVSPSRLAVMMLIVIIPKFAISIALGYQGILYLVYTPSPGDLILNALALQCVQDMDEFLFEHLMPKRIQKRVGAVTPLEISPRARLPYWIRKVVCMRAIGTLCLLLISLAVSAQTALVSEIVNAAETRRLLCGGNTNFIYARDAATGLISTADTSLEFGMNEMFQTYAFRAVLQKTSLDLTGVLDLQASTGRGILGDYDALERRRLSEAFALFSTTTTNKVFDMNKESFSQASESLGCSDIVNNDTDAASINESLHASFQGTFPDGETCSDIQHQCDTATARSYCPETCGCNVHISGMLDRGGCPDACRVMVDTQLSRDVTAVNSVSGACADRATFSTQFRRYFDELQSQLVYQGKLVSRQLPFLPPIQPQAGDFVWLSDELLVLYAFSTEFRYWLHANVTIDLGRVAMSSYINTVNLPTSSYSPCKFIEVVYKIFDFDACHPDPNTLGGNAGDLGAICPRTCGYCTIPSNTDYRDQTWDSLYDWMVTVTPTDTMIAATTFQESCNMYSWYHPTFREAYMHFCYSDVGLTHGFPGWFTSMKVVFPDLDILAMVAPDTDAVELPTSTTSSTTTTSKTTSTSTTSTSTTTLTTTTTTATTTTTTSTSTTTTVTTTTTTTTSTTTTTTASTTTTTTATTTTTTTTTADDTTTTL